MTGRSGALRTTVDGLEVIDVRELERYEGRVVGGDARLEPAIVVYATEGDVIALQHTEVPPELEGQGVARRLVQAVLDDVRARGLRVVPNCGYVRAFLRRHAEYQELVHPAYAGSVVG